MKSRLARLLRSVVLGLVSTIVSQQPGAAQSYPDKPVKLVVPFAAGGPADALGRILGVTLPVLMRGTLAYFRDLSTKRFDFRHCDIADALD